MPYHCECEQCQNKEFNPENYLIKEEDFKILDKERPLGISGHLRVKDEAMSIAECIDSCIDALDELIITYNKSTDATEEILKEYEKKYPDKIKLYFYKPNIIKYDANEYKTKYSSIHYLPNYYNFGYIKTKYKYYMKIDADQIYFTEKFLEIREALLSNINKTKNINKLLIIQRIAYLIPFKKLRNNFRTNFIKKIFNKEKNYNYNGTEDILSFKDFIIYNKFLYKNKLSYELGGIDLILNDNQLYCNTDFIFNGCVGDHFIFIPKSKNRYFMSNAGIESINTENNKSILGFLWVHLGDIKRNKRLNNKDKIKFDDIIKLKLNDIDQYITLIEDKNNHWHRDFGEKYFDIDKKYLTKEFYDQYLKNPLEYAVKYYGDNIERLW